MRNVCYGCGGHAPHAALCVALYSGGRGRRASFARGARVMRYVGEPRALRIVGAGNCATWAGGREGRATCAVCGSSTEDV